MARPTPLAIHPVYQNAKYTISHLNSRTFSYAYAGISKPEYRTGGWIIKYIFKGYYTIEEVNNEDGLWIIPRLF